MMTTTSMHRGPRRRSLLQLAGAGMAAAALPSLAQDYPARPIRLVVGYTTGGGTDILARLLSPRLGELLGQPVVVENRPGASGTIGANAVAKAPADGYTLLMGNNASNAVVSSLVANVPYNPRTDFTPIALSSVVPHLIAVAANSPIRTVADLLAQARTNPGKLSYGSPGLGSAPYLAEQVFESIAKVSLLHVPYRGAGSAITDMIGGQIQVSFDTSSTLLGQVKGGTIRALAVASRARLPQLPDVPTAAEAGIPGFAMSAWFGLFGPAGLPVPIAQRLKAAMDQIAADAPLRERIVATMASEPLEAISTEAFRQFVLAEIDRYAALVKRAGIKPE